MSKVWSKTWPYLVVLAMAVNIAWFNIKSFFWRQDAK
jgi:hypothetical protein